MNEDWMTELEPRAGEELERQLDRFVRVRLDPSPTQVKRARSAVIEAAWRQRLNAPATAATDEPSVAAAAMTVLPSLSRPSTPSRGLFGGWSARRLGASFAAALLAGLMLGTSVFASSRAGGPLYDARLALEELTLPTDTASRVEAELALAQARLADIVEASSRNDPGAVAAAVRGYLASLDDLGESIGGPADRALIAIQAHREVLLRVLGEVPEEARSGIENALAQSSKVIERLDAAATPRTGPTSGTGGPGGNSGAAGAGNGSGGAGNGGGGTGAGTGGNGGAGAGTGGKPEEPAREPARTPKPARTSAPTERPERPTQPDPDKGAQGGKP